MENKKSKFRIIILGTLSVLFVIFISLGFYARSKINPKEIRSIALEEIQKVFPRGKVTLGELDLGFGLNVNLLLNDFKIEYPYRGKSLELVGVDKVDVKIPLYTILTGGGKIELNVNSPRVSHIDIGNSNSWKMAMGSSNKTKNKTKPKIKSSNLNEKSSASKSDVSPSSFAIPLFVINSSLDLNINKLNFRTGEYGKKLNSIVISKFMIRNLGLKKDAAYEVDSELKFFNENKEEISTNALLIGVFNLRNYIEKGEIGTTAQLTLKNLKTGTSSGPLSDVKHNIKVLIQKNGSLSGKYSGEVEKSNFEMIFSSENDVVKVTNINMNFYFENLKPLLGKNTLPSLGSKAGLNLSGTVNLSKNKIYPNLKFKTLGPIPLSISGQSAVMTSSGSITSKKVKSLNNIKMFGGELDTNLTANINLNSKNKELQQVLRNYNLEVLGSNLTFEKDYLQNLIYKKDDKKNNVEGTTSSSSQTNSQKQPSNKENINQTSFPLLPKGKIVLDLKKVNMGGQLLGLNGLLETTLKQLNIKNLRLKGESGFLNLNNTTKIYKTSMKSKFNVKLKDFNISSLEGLMPKNMTGTKGAFSGIVNGTAITGKKLTYDTQLNIKGINGDLKGVDFDKYASKVMKLATKIPGLKKKVDPNKKIKINSNFQLFELNGRIKQNHYHLAKTRFLGVNKNIDIFAKGDIYPLTDKKEGKVYADVIEEKYLSKYVQAYVGKKEVPVLFKGKKLELNPDYQYTTKKLTKNFLKSKNSKVKKKAVDKIKNKLNDVFKGKGDKKLDKLLKGLF